MSSKQIERWGTPCGPTRLSASYPAPPGAPSKLSLGGVVRRHCLKQRESRGEGVHPKDICASHYESGEINKNRFLAALRTGGKRSGRRETRARAPAPHRCSSLWLWVAGSAPASNIMTLLAAGPDGRSPQGGRKVRTPQSSVPDNVREGGVKPVRRKVLQNRYRLGRQVRVRVKRCGKSAPPSQ